MFPFISTSFNAKVSKKFPNIIQIEIKEREKMFQIETKTGYFIDIDEQGYIIDCSQEKEDLIVIKGMEITEAYIKSNIAISKDFAPTFVKYVSKLAKVEEIEITSQKIPHCIVDITEKVESYIPIQEINLTPIISRLEKQQEKTQKEIIKLQSMLKNEKFIANAPAQVLETNKKTLIEQEEKLIKIQAELKSLKG